MKRKWSFVFLSIIGFIIAIYGWRYYREIDILNKVPLSATEIVSIDFRQLEHHLLIDFIKNPFDYISDEPSREDKNKPLLKEVVVPRNLFFFTDTSTYKDIWLSNLIMLKNEANFLDYLINENFEKRKEIDDLRIYAKGNFFIAIKQEQLILAYQYGNRGSVANSVRSLFNEKTFLTRESKPVQSIIDSEADILYVGLERNFLAANFKQGIFKLEGEINSALFLTGKYPSYANHSIAYCSAKLDKKQSVFYKLLNNIDSKPFEEFTKLSLNKIIDQWDGSLNFQLTAIENKIDTIVTYDYDEDFNKIEKSSVQETVLPLLELSLGTEGDSLSNYLTSKNAVQVSGSDTLFTSLPLYQLYFQKATNHITISTNQRKHSTRGKNNKGKLDVYFNLEKYLLTPLEFHALPVEDSYMFLFKDVSIQLSAENDLSIKVQAKEKNRNFFSQLFRH